MAELDSTPTTEPAVLSNNPGEIQNFRELSVGAGSDVAKFNREGFFIGAVNFTDAPFKVTYQGVVTATGLVIVGGTIRNGQTAYNTGTGYWLGTDSGTPKLSIGDGATKYLTWDGTNLTIRGTLNADDIVAGTLTGRTFKAVGSGVAADVWVTNGGAIEFYFNGVNIATLFCSSASEVLLSANNDISIASGDNFFASGDATFIVSNGDNTNVFNDNGGSDSCRWINDSSLTMEHRDNGDLAISGSYL